MSQKISLTDGQLDAKGSGATPTDDLTRIRGISAKIVQRLKDCGISTFSQLAALTPQEIAEQIGPKMGVTAAQIARQDWTSQARLFAAEPAESSSHEGGLQATSYVVELYLDGDRRVNRTRILDVRSGEEDMWPSWSQDRLLEFFANRAELNLQTPEAAPLRGAIQLPPATEEPAGEPGRSGSEQAETEKATHEFARAVLSCARLDIIPKGTDAPSVMLERDQPFHVRLAVELASFGACTRSLEYNAVIMAKSMGSPQRLNLAEASGTAALNKYVKVHVRGMNPPPGLYRTQALVTVFDSHQERQTVVLRSIVEGGVLRVD